jgi:hypothetical protein
MPQVQLFNSANGLSCVVDAGGKGLRGKSWLDELSRWAKEAVEPTALAGIGLGRLANFPTIIDGRKNEVRALGEALVDPAYSGVELFECVPQSTVFATGDAAALTFGQTALTQPILATANYGTAAGTTHSDAVLAPVGGQSPAYVLSDTGVANFNLGATDGILTVIVNGTTFTVNVGTGAATTLANIVAAMTTSGIPVITTLHNTNFILLSTVLPGVTQSINVVNTAGTAGAVLFATNGGALRSGNGSAIGDMSLTQSTTAGNKVQRRILPGSVQIDATVAGVANQMTDDRAGVLADLAAAHAGTINYATGAITLTYTAAPAAAAINASWRALIPVELHREVRLPERTVTQMAIRLL